MARRKKPSVIMNCGADYYSLDRERIIEFSFQDGKGGLISFLLGQNGDPHLVQIYALDEGIDVTVSPPEKRP